MTVPPPLKPPRLCPGGTIGVFSPSWGGAGAYPHWLARGVAQLEALGYRVKLGRHALNERDAVSDTAENRVTDLDDIFRDDDVRG